MAEATATLRINVITKTRRTASAVSGVPSGPQGTPLIIRTLPSVSGAPLPRLSEPLPDPLVEAEPLASTFLPLALALAVPFADPLPLPLALSRRA